jgi:hypothetical protein
MATLKPGRSKTKAPPHKPGIYRLKRGGKVEKVGESSDLARRKREHKKANPGHDFEYQVADSRSTSKTRRRHEKRQIKKYHPPLNQRKGGGRRLAR